MSKTKIIALAILGLIAFAAIWYLFIKNYNYKISFKTPQPVGSVYATLAEWNNLIPSETETVDLLSKKPFSEVKYKLSKADSLFNYNWEIDRINDSLTEVIAYIKDENHSLYQNLNVPFTKTDFVHSNVTEVRKIMNFLKELDKVYDVKVKKDSIYTVDPKFCAYVNINSTISGKATAMYENIVTVMGYIRNNELELNGHPFLTIEKLDLERNTINFDFCFPIKESDSLPPTEKVLFKKTPKFKAIKALYNGNYRSSDYAWYQLMDYAERNDIEITHNPMEIFWDDPQSGTNASEWRAEIYMPIVD